MFIISHRRLRKAFTAGVLHAHKDGNAWMRYGTHAEQWAYEAGYREGEKVVQRNATLRRTQESIDKTQRKRAELVAKYSRLDPVNWSIPARHVPIPPSTPRPRDPTTNKPVPRGPDPFLPGERKEPIRGHY